MNADDTARRQRIIRIWLWAVAIFVFAIVIVGGATRMTESGLSIVEWKPLTGVVPPLNEADWQAEFEKYKTIPQYRLRNLGMSLHDFKTIYWWEWTHRLLGRLIGFVFLLPLLFFQARGWIAPEMRARLWGIFALGALQGGVGWWMVYSGLSDRTEVAPIRLATHLTIACVIVAALVWTAGRMTPTLATPAPARLRLTSKALAVLVLCQIFLGALVAGLRAGLTYNTWPLLDGQFIPAWAQLFAETPVWRNLLDNVLTVQFNHRMAAYVIWAIAIAHAADALRTAPRTAVARRAVLVAAAVTLQAVVGILTLISAAPISLALTHQAFAVIVLALAIRHAERLSVPSHRPASVNDKTKLLPSV